MSKEKSFQDKAKDMINNVKDDSKNFTKKEAEAGKGMGVLSYIIPPIPYFVEKKNKFVRYHAVQGMNLFVVAIAYAVLRWVLSYIYIALHCGGGWAGKICRAYAGGWYLPWYLNIPMLIIGAAITILCIIGILDVVGGKAKELPLLNKIKIFKK